jgi:hypothetical protein
MEENPGDNSPQHQLCSHQPQSFPLHSYPTKGNKIRSPISNHTLFPRLSHRAAHLDVCNHARVPSDPFIAAVHSSFFFFFFFFYFFFFFFFFFFLFLFFFFFFFFLFLFFFFFFHFLFVSLKSAKFYRNFQTLSGR